MKTGIAHLSSLRDGRQVYINGGVVTDVTAHPAFKNSVRSAAALYDFQSAPENTEKMTFASPTSGRRVNKCWRLPTSYAELVDRRQAMELWATLHNGYLGRSPDHVASCLGGMVMGLATFEAYDTKRAAALQSYFQYARDNDLYLTYVIINPQADRSKAAHEQSDMYLTAAIVDEDAEGMTVRGAKMLATGGIMANEVFVSCIQPMKKGDEAYAFSCVVPMNARGLKILSRKSYEQSSPSIYDNPLGSRYDENDSVLYFDDVKVPWERVFVARDTDMLHKQFHETPAHVFQNYQCQVRLMVKLRFLVGVARRIAEINGTIAFPPVRETLGQLAAQAAMVEGLVYGMEAKGRMWNGFYVPDRHLMYSAQVLTQQLYSVIITTIRDLAGGGMIMLPSSADDFQHPEIASLIYRTQQSPAASSEERVKFFKLAWDAVGSEFASRHSQYEMFYAGATFVTKGHSFRTYDWDAAARLVENTLDGYDLPATAGASPMVAIQA